MQPGIASVADDFHEPSPGITALEAGKESEGTQVCILDHVLGVLLIARQPPRQVVGSVQMGQNFLFKGAGLILLYQLCHHRLHFASMWSVIRCDRIDRVLLARVQTSFPAVADTQPIVKELIDFPPGSLETNHGFAGKNGLVALSAIDSFLLFASHKSPLALDSAIASPAARCAQHCAGREELAMDSESSMAGTQVPSQVEAARRL